MATASQIERRALRLINVLDSSESLDANVEQDAREVLNNLGQRWLASGLLADWTDASLPTSSLVTPASANEALAHNLAVLLAPEYGRPVPEWLAQEAVQYRVTLWRDRLAATTTSGTAENVILRALRIIGAGNLPDTVSFPQALDALNVALAELHEAQVGIPDYSVASLATAMDTDIADRDALAYQLALRLAPEYGVSLSPEALQMAAESMARLRLRYFQPGSVDFGELPAETPTFNITTGE